MPENTPQNTIEEQMKWLQKIKPQVFGGKMSMIVKSTLVTVDKQAREETLKEIDIAFKKAVWNVPERFECLRIFREELKNLNSKEQ